MCTRLVYLDLHGSSGAVVRVCVGVGERLTRRQLDLRGDPDARARPQGGFSDLFSRDTQGVGAAVGADRENAGQESTSSPRAEVYPYAFTLASGIRSIPGILIFQGLRRTAGVGSGGFEASAATKNPTAADYRTFVGYPLHHGRKAVSAADTTEEATTGESGGRFRLTEARLFLDRTLGPAVGRRGPARKGGWIMRVSRFRRSLALAACLLLLGNLALPGVSHAKTAQEIDAGVDAALARFDQQVTGGANFLATAEGVLVLPDVVKAAFVIGGQYGEGALRVGGSTNGYYSIAGGSWGASIGIQKKDLIIVFRDRAALQQFKDSSGWQVGVDGAATLVNVGVGADVSTMQINQPIVAFVVGQKGLMFDVSLQGAKISKLNK